MTVQSLINTLKKFDPQSEITIRSTIESGHGTRVCDDPSIDVESQDDGTPLIVIDGEESDCD